MLKCTESWVFIVISVIISALQYHYRGKEYSTYEFSTTAFYTTAFVAVNEITNCKYIVVVAILYGLNMISRLFNYNGDGLVMGYGLFPRKKA